MENKDLWQAVLAELQLNLSRANYSAWFKQTDILNITPLPGQRQLTEIAVQNQYAKNTIEARYYGQIKEILDRLTKSENELKITVQAPKISPNQTAGPLFQVDFDKEKAVAYRRAISHSRLRPDFTFANFAVSSSNEMAHAAAQAVAKNPGKTYHLLFLYGGVGVGKTHLSQAIGHAVLKADPYAPVVYCTSEEFTNAIVEAIRNKTTREFRQKYRSAKILLIDDIQFIAGKETIQQEFFHTFNTIHAEGGQIVITSDRLPQEIIALEDRLRSRFEGGLTIDVQAPNFELRTAILLIKAKRWRVTLPMDVAQLIAGNIQSTRLLEGFLTRLITQSEIKKEPLTPELCQTILRKAKNEPIITKGLIKPREILDQVAAYFRLKPAVLKGPRRNRPIVVPRQIAMYLMRTELETPLMEVGFLFGGRDHTTVMHSVEKITKELSVSETLRLDVNALKKRITHYGG